MIRRVGQIRLLGLAALLVALLTTVEDLVIF